MRITVNGEARDAGGTIADLLQDHLGERQPRGVAVAVGDDVVPRADWDTRHVREGDAVEIVTAVQGG